MMVCHESHCSWSSFESKTACIIRERRPLVVLQHRMISIASSLSPRSGVSNTMTTVRRFKFSVGCVTPFSVIGTLKMMRCSQSSRVFPPSLIKDVEDDPGSFNTQGDQSSESYLTF